MKKILVFLFLSGFFCNAYSQTITLFEGTIVRVRLMETLDSRISKEGDMINFEAVEDVIVDGVTVIKKGASAKGMVLSIKKSGIGGKKGELSISIDYVTAVNGKNIKLKYSASSAGESRSGGAVAGALLINPLLILVKGKSATIEKDKEFNVYVDKDYEFNLEDFKK